MEAGEDASEEELFHVVHEDGDEEDLGYDEVVKSMQPPQLWTDTKGAPKEYIIASVKDPKKRGGQTWYRVNWKPCQDNKWRTDEWTDEPESAIPEDILDNYRKAHSKPMPDKQRKQDACVNNEFKTIRTSPDRVARSAGTRNSIAQGIPTVAGDQLVPANQIVVCAIAEVDGVKTQASISGTRHLDHGKVTFHKGSKAWEVYFRTNGVLVYKGRVKSVREGEQRLEQLHKAESVEERSTR